MKIIDEPSKTVIIAWFMPYSRNADLPSAVREALPPRAQRVFREAFNGATGRGLSEERAFASAWGAVKNAGWHRDKDGHWVKKAQPGSADVHVDHPMGGRKKPKPNAKPKPKSENDDDEDDDETNKVVSKAETAATFEFSVAKSAVGAPVIDEDQNLVFGWLSIIEQDGQQVIDLQGDVIDEDVLEKAAYDMVLNGCDAGEMHKRIGIGEGLVECMMFTKAKQQALGIDLGKVGLWVGFKVDAEAFAKVKSGEYTAFSLGGIALAEEMEEAA